MIGRMSWKRAPWGSASSKTRSPPWARAYERAIAIGGEVRARPPARHRARTLHPAGPTLVLPCAPSTRRELRTHHVRHIRELRALEANAGRYERPRINSRPSLRQTGLELRASALVETAACVDGSSRPDRRGRKVRLAFRRRPRPLPPAPPPPGSTEARSRRLNGTRPRNAGQGDQGDTRTQSTSIDCGSVVLSTVPPWEPTWRSRINCSGLASKGHI
jgi:hypothetical protein